MQKIRSNDEKAKAGEIAEPLDTHPEKGTTWNGFGLWNVFFFCEFLLSYLKYININLLYNTVLACWLILPTPWRWLRWVRNFVGFVGAVVLLYSESWLPSLSSFFNNLDNLRDFSVAYYLDFFASAINWDMVSVLFVMLVLYYLTKDWINITACTVITFLACFVGPLIWHNIAPLMPIRQIVVAQSGDVQSTTVKKTEAEVPQNELTVAKSPLSLDDWLSNFYEDQLKQQVNFPDAVSPDQTPFDLIFLNICSLAKDDLVASGINLQAFEKHFDIVYEKFNSATSYSGPATIRLLRGACGQRSHRRLYEGREPECEIVTQLQGIGFHPFFYMDHNGEFEDYIGGLRERAGLSTPLSPIDQLPRQYTAFDGSGIVRDSAVFDKWLKDIEQKKGNSVTLFNLVSLHDGTRDALDKQSVPYKPRAELLIKDIENFMEELQKTGRNIMLIVIPEHGAALRGDVVQMARLRDLPSRRITDIPVMVKFFGANMPHVESPVLIKETSSYQSLSEMVKRVITSNFFASKQSLGSIEELTSNLPKTDWVAENSGSIVLERDGQDYVRIGDGQWLPYAKP